MLSIDKLLLKIKQKNEFTNIQIDSSPLFLIDMKYYVVGGILLDLCWDKIPNLG